MTSQEVDDLRKELADLKSLVNRFLDSIYAASFTQFRDIDCDPNLVGSLWKESRKAVERPSEEIWKRYQ